MPVKRVADAMTDRVFCFVQHGSIKDFESLGWEYHEDVDGYHASAGSIYEWKGKGDPVYPPPKLRTVKKMPRTPDVWPPLAEDEIEI